MPSICMFTCMDLGTFTLQLSSGAFVSQVAGLLAAIVTAPMHVNSPKVQPPTLADCEPSMAEVGEMRPATVEPELEGLHSMLKDDVGISMGEVGRFQAFERKRRAMVLLTKLEPTQLAPHAASIARAVGDEGADLDVRRVGLHALGTLLPTDLAPFGGLVARCIAADPASTSSEEGYYIENAWELRVAAIQTLGCLEPQQLAPYVGVLEEQLRDDDWDVRHT